MKNNHRKYDTVNYHCNKIIDLGIKFYLLCCVKVNTMSFMLRVYPSTLLTIRKVILGAIQNAFKGDERKTIKFYVLLRKSLYVAINLNKKLAPLPVKYPRYIKLIILDWVNYSIK